MATAFGVAIALAQGALAHDGDVAVSPLMQLPLPDLPGKEGLVLKVVYPPGFVEPAHRHDAHAFVYCLSGSVEMQMAGGKPVVLKPGDMFYEDPSGEHRVGRNLSKTKTATLIVFLVKDIGKAPVLPPTKN
ncbi:cupin domain-containing protein [Usitatibacter rugosus]|nr:cupin domain-containing protein [Usitatibacter rugosus]